MLYLVVFFFKQKTAYEMRISDWSSDVCSSDLVGEQPDCQRERAREEADHLDRQDDDAERDVDALRPEQREEVQPVLPEADDQHDAENDEGERERHCDEIGRASCRERGCQYV